VIFLVLDRFDQTKSNPFKGLPSWQVSSDAIVFTHVLEFSSKTSILLGVKALDNYTVIRQEPDSERNLELLLEETERIFYYQLELSDKLDAKATSFILFYSILFGAEAIVVSTFFEMMKSTYLLSMHLLASSVILSFLGLFFAVLGLRPKVFAISMISRAEIDCTASKSYDDLCKHLIAYYVDEVQPNKLSNDKKASCLSISSLLAVLNLSVLALFLVVIIIREIWDS